MEADAVLREIEELSKKEFLPIIGSVKGKHLVSAVRKFKVKSVLEVGTLVGYSAILIASNLPEEGKVVTIEIKPESAERAKENILKAGMADKIEVHVGNALNVIRQLKGKFDMVFIDATKDEYLEYLKLAEGKLKKNGVVFADNVKMFAGEMQDYLGHVRNSGKYKSENIDVGFDAVEVSTKLF
jgi:caffeoyl-CoA O-methyltransferase